MKNNRLTLLLLTVALLLTANLSQILHAQTDYSSRKATSRIGVGVGAAIGIALPTGGDLPDSIEAAPGFAFRGGINLTYPITRTFGVLFNGGLDLRSIGKKVSGQSTSQSYGVSYLFLEPGVSVSAFRLSLNIGLPSNLTLPDSGAVPATKDDLEMMLEPRLGATLVLMDEKEWWLGLNVDVGLALNKLYKDEAITRLVLEKDVPAMSMLSAHLGVTWQYGIPGTGGF
jgi:hypothetical protein